MLCTALPRPCLNNVIDCKRQRVSRANLTVTASARLEDSCQSAEPATQAALLEDQAARASPLRHLAVAFTTAAVSSPTLPCHAIVEEKLTGSPAYKPSQTELGWEVIVGAVVATVPLIVASYEFGKRILIQRRCPVCKGSGLIARGRFLRKCSQCGGFLPWQGWKTFFLSTAAPGNGGPLRQPRGQTGVFYKVPPRQLEEEKEQRQEQRQQQRQRFFKQDNSSSSSDTSG
ncbi:hypothetical protein WJX74_009758 [Apatococcus lobatus]|uniref:Uncharacterized protein n=2 Tax=Apatococcus TaxID=904362 RepID=A0AAW1RJY9_9CHLO